MSQEIDNKVVKMEFDNSNFESNVKQSMSTLEKLKKDLDFEGSAEGFKNISKAAKEVSFDGLNQGVEDVKVHFSALETIATTALATITSQAVNTGLAMAKSLSIDRVFDGFNQYESKTESVQTIMNATGKSIDEVNASLDELVWFADETSYSFGDMVNNVGKFTSVGVDLDTASKAMMGISNWAAVSGQNAQTATRAMYNLSQAMGLGYVGLTDWRSIELANMNTLEFKQNVIDTAVAMGKLKEGEVTVQNFRESLKDKWFDNDVLLSVLGKYGDYTELVYQRVTETGESCAEAMKNVSASMAGSYEAVGEKAFIAAQEAKTFHEAIEATGDAVKTQWANLFESIFGDYEDAKVTFTNLANSLWTVFAEPLSNFNDTVAEAMEAPKVDLADWNNLKDSLKSNLGMTSDGLLEFEEVLKQVARDAGIDVDKIIEDQGSFAAFVADGNLDTSMIQEAYKRIQDGTATAGHGLEEFQDIVNRVWNGEFGNGEERRNLLEAAGFDPDEIQRLVDLGPGVELTIEDIGETAVSVSEDLKKLVEGGASIEELNEMLSAVSGKDLRNGIWNNLFSYDEENPGVMVKYVNAIRDSFADIFGTLDSGAIHDALAKIYEWTLKLLDEDRVNRFKKTVDNIFHALHTGLNLIKGAFSVVKAVWDNTLGPLLSGLWDIVKSIISGIGDLFEGFDKATSGTNAFSTAVNWLNEKLEPVKRVIEAVTGGIRNFIELLFGGTSVSEAFEIAVGNALHSFFGFDISGTLKFEEAFEKFKELKDTVSETIDKIKKKFTEAFEVFKKTDLGQAISNIATKIRDALVNAWQAVKDWFNNIFSGDSDFSYLDGVKSGLTSFNEWLDNFDLSGGVKKVSDGISNFGEGVKTKFGEIKDWIDNNETISGIKDGVKTKVGEIKEAFNEGEQEAGGEKEPFVVRVLNGLKSVVQWFLDNMPSLEDIFHIITGLIASSAFTSLMQMFLKARELFSGGSGLLNGITKVLNGLGRALNAFALQMTGRAIWDMAKSFALVIGVVIAGLVALTLVDQNKLATAGIVMLGVGAGVAFLAKAFVSIMGTLKDVKDNDPKKITEAISSGISDIASGVKNYLTITAYASAIQKVAIAIGILTGSIFAISKLSWADIAKGLITVAALLAEVVLAIKAMGSEKKLLVDMNALMGISGAVMMFVNTFKDIAKYNWEEILKGVVTIGAILLEVSLFTRIAGDMKASTGVALIATAISMLLFCRSIKKIAELEPEQLLYSVLAIGAIMAEMTVALKYTSGGVKVSSMAAMIVLAASMLIFTKSIKELSNYSWDQLLFSVLAIGAVMAEVVGFAKLMEKIDVSVKAMALALVLAISINSFSKSIKELAAYNWTQLLVSVLAIGAVMAEMVAFAKLFEKINMDGKNALAIAAVTAAVMAFAIALKLLSTIPWSSLLAGAAAIAGILLAIAGTAVLLDKVSGSVEHITKLLLAIAGVIAAVSLAIWLVVQAIDGANLDNVKTNLGELVTSIVGSIVQGIVGSIGQIVQGIVDLFSQLVENAPQIVDMAITFIIEILDKLSERLPELATSLAHFCEVLINSLKDAFQNIDLTPLASVLQNMLIATIGLAFVGKFGSFASITKGIVMMAEVIAAFGLLIAAFGALNLIPGFTEFMAGGVEALCTVAEGIGRFVGTLAGTAAESFTESLPQIGTYLSEFMTNVQGFIDGMGNIKGDFLESIGVLSLSMLEITGANFVDTVMNGLSVLFGGGTSTDFMAKFVDLGNALSEFAASISDVDFSAVDGAANAAAVLGALMTIVPREGGLLQKIIGEQDLTGIDVKFGNLGAGVAAFCGSLQGITIDESSVAAANTAATIIQNLMDKAVPRTGGLWQKIIGEQDIGSAGDNFASIGNGVKSFCSSLEGITVDQVTVTTAGMAADIIAQLMGKEVQQNEGGLWQKIVGQSNVANSATNFESVGLGLAAFCSAIEGISVDQVTVTTASMAADIIANMMEKSVESTGGLWQKIVGEKDTANAGTNFANIGAGLASFCSAISTITIDQTTVETVGMAADAVALIMDKGVEGQGGLWQKIVGEKDVTNAGENFKNIGEGLAAFCVALEDVTIDQVTVTTAGMAAEIIKDLMSSDAVITDGGIWQKIVGVKDPTTAPENFKHLGEGVANFCNALVGVTLDQTTFESASKSVGLIKLLMETSPKSTGLIGWLTGGDVNLSSFGTDLSTLGTGIAGFVDGVKNTTKVTMERGKIAASGIIEIMNLDWPTEGGLLGLIANGIAGGGVSFDDIKTDLGKIGEMAQTVKTGFSDVTSDDTENAKAVSQGIIDILKLSWPTSGGIIDDIINAFSGGETGFSALSTTLSELSLGIKTFSTNVTGIDTTVIDSAKTAATSILSIILSISSEDVTVDTEKISRYSDGTVVIGDGVLKFSLYAEKLNNDAITNAVSSIESILDIFESISDADLDSATNFSNAIETLAKTGINKFADAFKNSDETVSTIITTFIGNAVKIFTDAKTQFSNAGSVSIAAYIKAIANAVTILALAQSCVVMVNAATVVLGNTATFQSAASGAIGAYGNAFARDETVERKAKGLANAAARSVRQYDSFYNAGDACLVGINNGFLKQEQTLYNNVSTVGANMLACFQQAVGVASPSTKFRDSTMYCIEGAVQGIEQYSDKLYDAVENTGTTTTDVMRAALAGLDFTDLDNSPVIRPVLDLTNIQNGAGAISNMLNADGMIGLDVIEAQKMADSINRLNLDAGSINNLYDDSDVLESIKDLGTRIDDLNTAILNMKFYLNGRDLVGGILPDIVTGMRNMEGQLKRGV